MSFFTNFFLPGVPDTKNYRRKKGPIATSFVTLGEDIPKEILKNFERNGDKNKILNNLNQITALYGWMYDNFKTKMINIKEDSLIKNKKIVEYKNVILNLIKSDIPDYISPDTFPEKDLLNEILDALKI